MSQPANAAAVTLRGRVEVVFYSSPKFSSGRLRVAPEKTVSFAGALMVRKHDPVILHGVWDMHPKYGRQFKVSHFEFDQRLDAEGLAHYLANHPTLKGIGPAKARRIADAFGDDFDRVIDQAPDRIGEVAKLSRAAVETLRDEWTRTRTLNASLTWLASFELTHHQMAKLISKFGNAIVTVLQNDPYLLVREIPGFGFKRIDQVARKMGMPKDHRSRVRAGLAHCVADRLDQGDCWVDYADLIELANALLVMDVGDSRDRIDAALGELIADGTLACESIGGHFLVAQPRMLQMEQDLAAVFTTKLGPNPHFASVAGDAGAAATAARIDAVDSQLNVGQRRAVELALAHNLVVASGGAGVGKTRFVAALAKVYEAGGRTVVLAAPTGKAAKRIEQVVGRAALTIHRLLGYKGKQFTRGIDNPVEADVVIIDEVSMVDVPLAWHLFRAIDFTKTCVVLVGDHNQLPPVGPGNVLRDLIERQPVPTVILDQVVRQAGVLKENSIAVLRGAVRPTADKEADGRRPWVVLNQLTEVADAQQSVLELYDTVLVEKLGFDLLADVQLLTPTRKGPLGVDALNVELQRRVQRKLWGVDVPPARPGWRPEFLAHDRVIQTRNNYDLDVMNGSIGTVIEVGPNRGELKVRFDDDDVTYTAETARELSLAYALTVHKCLHPDTLVETPEGLFPIRSIRRDAGVVATPEGPRGYDSFVENPSGELLELVTQDGYRLTVTPEHGVDVWTDAGLSRVCARDISAGDLLRLKLGVTCDPIEAPLLGEPPEAHASARRYRYPRVVTLELAEFLGLMVADGTLFERGICLVKRHADVRDRFASLCETLFGATPQRYAVGKSYAAKVGSREIAAWLRQLGGMEPRAKAVPDCILRSPVALHVAFLRGLFENGTVQLRPDGVLDRIEWKTTYPALDQTVRTMLLRLGIITGTTPSRPGSVYLYGANARRFREQVGFVAAFKQARAAGPVGVETRYALPLTDEEARRMCAALVPIGALTPAMAGSIGLQGKISRHVAGIALSRVAATRAVADAAGATPETRVTCETPETPETPEESLLRKRLGFHYSAVREVRRLAGPSMCIRVPDGSRFLQNGFSAWNSQGSEFPCVILVVHKAHAFMHHRNLFYTGVTRARKVAIVVGDHWGITNCAQKQQVERRRTFLSLLDLTRQVRSRGDA